VRLWGYLNSTERQRRLGKWQLEHGDSDAAPLFINRSGRPIVSKSVSNVISKVRAELTDRSLERDFHDLRSTFATNLAKFMLKQLRIGRVVDTQLRHAGFYRAGQSLTQADLSKVFRVICIH
jgi:integrase